MLRLVHTADWHLGHSLHGHDRGFEHGEFLDWLLALLEGEAVDALVIAGDVFDSANPPASAQRAFYGFLVDARRRCPGLDTVVIAGNHDSPGRLEAPSPLLDALGVRVVGNLPRTGDALDLERLLVPLSAGGEPAGWCAAVPYLRPADLVGGGEADDPLVAGVARVYGAALEGAAARAGGLPVVATGHCYMTGGRVSELSERRILGGNQHALPAGIFPDDVAYAALGHLHLAQAVGGRDEVRYSGSPIPLALDEARYPHQVVAVELAGDAVRLTPHRVPRTVEIVRVPERGALPPDDLVEVVGALELAELPPERWPFLDLAVRLDGPRPDLRRRVDEALEGRPARLARLTAVRAGEGPALGDALPEAALEALDPDEVFQRRWAQEHEGEPPEAMAEAFRELVREVEEAGR